MRFLQKSTLLFCVLSTFSFAGVRGIAQIYTASNRNDSVSLSSGRLNDVRTLGHSYVSSNGVVGYDYPFLFGARHNFHVINLGDGSGIGVADSRYWSRATNFLVSDSNITTSDIASNDMFNGTSLFDYARGLSYSVLWDAIPDTLKIKTLAVTYTGSWVYDSTLNIKYKSSSVSGDYLEFTTSGSVVVIGYWMNTTGGSFTVSIDGVVTRTISCLMSMNWAGQTYSPGASIFEGLIDTTHVIRITKNFGTNRAYFSWAYGGSPSRPLIPASLIGGVTPVKASHSGGRFVDSAARFTRLQDSIVAKAQLAGLNVKAYHYTIDTALFRDAVHMDSLGMVAIAESLWASLRQTTIQRAVSIILLSSKYADSLDTARGKGLNIHGPYTSVSTLNNIGNLVVYGFETESASPSITIKNIIAGIGHDAILILQTLSNASSPHVFFTNGTINLAVGIAPGTDDFYLSGASIPGNANNILKANLSIFNPLVPLKAKVFTVDSVMTFPHMGTDSTTVSLCLIGHTLSPCP